MMTNASNPAESFLDALAPHVSTEVRKGIESLKKIMEMFPGRSPADIEKSVRAMLASATTSVSSMVERARNLLRDAVEGEEKSPDSPAAFLKDAGKCTAGDLKSIAAGLGLPVPSQKKGIIEELQEWIE